MVLKFGCMFVRSKPGERGILVMTVCVFVLTALLMFVLFGIYLFTDCRQKFRGVSDIFLALSFVVLFYFGIFLIYAVVDHFSVPKLDRLLSIMAEAGNRNDEDSLLLLEVGEDCLRRFWEQQLRENLLVSMSVRRTCPGLTYCIYVILLPMPILLFYFYNIRASVFLTLMWCQLGFYLVRYCMLQNPRVQRWLHQRQVKAQLANLPQRQTVVLFHNNRSQGRMLC